MPDVGPLPSETVTEGESVESQGLLAALVLGVIQGVTEWIPVSSEAAVAATYSIAFGGRVEDAISYALWLHIGTVLSATIAFRREILAVGREILTTPGKTSPLTRYLVKTVLVSAVVGFPLILGLSELSERVGGALMLGVGALLLVTALLQLRMRSLGPRTRDDVNNGDALLCGVAQGLATLPGLSRSGLTVATLLGRRVDRREALTLSFLMGIPASMGAGLFAGLEGGLFFSAEALLALAVGAAVGLVTIRALLAVADRVSFGHFVLLVAAVVVAGAIWRLAGS